MTSIPVGRSGNRPVKTCTECKQVKLRCDSRQKFPAPCSRCQVRHLHCIIDSSFRRTPARRRVEEMARELEALKHQKGEGGMPRETASPSQDDSLGPSPEDFVETPGAAAFDYSDLDSETFQLAEFMIDSQSVTEIFQIFSALFHPHFPVLDPATSISSLYRSSPLLFWTIIAAVTGRQIVVPSHLVIFNALKEPYLNKLRSDILKAPLNLQSIQALAYLTAYPLPMRNQVTDPSWQYCGLMVNAALYMGLHHPKPMQSLRSIGVVPGSIRERATTWCGCFVTSTSHGLINGLSPLIHSPSELETIERFAREAPIPREFAYHVMVHHTLAKFTDVLNDPRGAVSHSLVQLVDGELDGLKAKISTEWTTRAEFFVLVAKLNLYTLAVVRMHADPSSRDILLQRGFTVSVRIIYLVDQGLHYTPDEYAQMPQDVLSRSLPKVYYRNLVFASIFLLRYFALNTRANPEEQEIARNQLAIAHKFLKSGSLDSEDERGRGALLLENLSRQKPFDIENVKLRIDNRMGASIVFDAVTTGHSIQNKPQDAESVEAEQKAAAEAEAARVSASPNPGFDSFSFSTGDGTGFNPLDFQLPEDIWGDNIWGMFDIGVAPQNQTY